MTVKAGEVVRADRPVSYMRGWPLDRVLKLAARWGWRVEGLDEQPPEPTPPAA